MQKHILQIEKIVGGGQAFGTLKDGRKAFVWGGLPSEIVEFRVTKKKSKLVEGIVEDVLEASPERILPQDPESFLSTSPWQIMSFNAENRFKTQLIHEAFELHKVELPRVANVFTDGIEYGYRNKIELSWFGDTDAKSQKETLDLAFFKRGSRGKIVVDKTSLARPEINHLAKKIRDTLQQKNISARQLKTLLIRADQKGRTIWQLYLKEEIPEIFDQNEMKNFLAEGGEVIFSDPRSPASVITKRLTSFGKTTLTDNILNIPFSYTAESFFQINLPVYEQALKDIKKWISPGPVLDLYSGVGTIGLTIGADEVELVEVNEFAVDEMKQNIRNLGKNARAILAKSELSLDFITKEKTIIIDPPRAGLHPNVVRKLFEATPPRIIYLSCNPVTQARDTALLLEKYQISHVQGYNFFPRTPHIENLVVLEKKSVSQS